MINLSRAERKTDLSVLKDIPGPGYYSSNLSPTQPSHIFATSNRTVSDLNTKTFEDYPGPGAYLNSSVILDSKQKKPFNSSSVRFQSYNCDWKPGPGTYYDSLKVNKNKKKIVQTLCVHPGPVPVSIPLLERHELAVYDGEESKVSPAEYSPQYEKIKPRKPASLFSKSKIQRCVYKSQGSVNLGPGCYSFDPPQTLQTKRTISLTDRFKETKNVFPGPGSYDPKISSTKPILGCFVSKLNRNFEIAKEIVQITPVKQRKKAEKIKENAVFVSKAERDCNKIPVSSLTGPGRYDFFANKKEGIVFGQQARFKITEESYLGPGSYNPSELPKSSSPVSFNSARFRKQTDLCVHTVGEKIGSGPGEYETHEKKNWGKGVSFDAYVSRLERKFEQPPDPGQYFLENVEGGGARIGGDERNRVGVESCVVGQGSGEFVVPGSYKSKNSMVKRAFDISLI